MPDYEFLTGVAGSGKTFEITRRVAEDEDYGTVVASTGIAAINIGGTTVNNMLKYSTTENLELCFDKRWLHRRLEKIDKSGVLKDRLIIDEISMVEARQIDILVKAFKWVFGNRKAILAVGDFLQLPPVEPGEFAFKAVNWPLFARNTTRLTKIWRQNDPTFLQALNLVRVGDPAGAALIREAGAEFIPEVDTKHVGITLFPTKAEASQVNGYKLAQLNTRLFVYSRTITGKKAPEWNEIAESIIVKIGSRVMVNVNHPQGLYVNGDLGTVVDADQTQVWVNLDRTGQDTLISMNIRCNYDWEKNPREEIGRIKFMPLQHGYALTVHKSQGLTLAGAQFDARHWFASSPALCYVALSRVRNASDLTIVGSVEQLAEKIKAHPEVNEYV